ncbi:MAG: septum site-determining protein MinC [Candidatus Velthaea sp.]|jgi:septum site-determining protein MinC
MTTIRGRGRSLEIAIDRALPVATAEIRAQLEERPAFFHGSRAAANLGLIEADLAGLTALRDVLAEFGITLDGVSGVEGLAPLLEQLELPYLGAVPVEEVAAIPRPRPKRNIALSDEARSLVADFAGARADLAARRTEREAAALERRTAKSNGSVTAPPSPPPPPVASAGVTIPETPQRAPAGISTLYHRGTLRGGQTLHNLGNIVIIGDVNPGAELIASGDILVFGSLRGVVHAGAQGDLSARVVALELAPTQLRIATMIATSEGGPAPTGPQHAYVLGDRIAVVPHAAADLGRREVPV